VSQNQVLSGQDGLLFEEGARLAATCLTHGCSRPWQCYCIAAEDVAAAALFLASAQSAFVTGTDLVVDGGNLAA
jgi:NAD(P)-dependent dehydrogenase (short-subunit alcohol dehydrogenase family)